jgi:hypothetical protein
VVGVITHLYLYDVVVTLPVLVVTLVTASGRPSSHLAPLRAMDSTLDSLMLLTTGSAAEGVYV